MSTFYAFSCATPNADLRMVVEYGLDVMTQRNGGRRPIAVHMHPALIRRYIAVHGDWPAHWPKLIENDAMNQTLVGIETCAADNKAPQQLRLI